MNREDMILTALCCGVVIVGWLVWLRIDAIDTSRKRVERFGENRQMKCTWENCHSNSEYPQIAKDGRTWANLCVLHNRELDKKLSSGNAMTIMAGWIRAQGGSKKAAEGMKRIGGNRQDDPTD